MFIGCPSSGHKSGLWLPGAQPPAHLTGEFPGDRGFDPLNLAADPAVYARMRIAEVFHGRCAMLGVVSALVPELLGKGSWLSNGEQAAIRKTFNTDCCLALRLWMASSGA
jgi:hypothetical protein